MKKKILLLSNKISPEGGYKAAYNFYKLLQKDSKVILYTNNLIKNNISNNLKLKIYHLINTIFWKITSKFYNISITLPAFDYVYEKNPNKFDNIILQYSNSIISLKFLESISKKKIFIFLHDEWIVNGFFHFKDQKYLSKHKFLNFIENLFCKIKKKSYLKLENVTIIGNCNWITNKAKRSRVFNNANYITMYNSIDTNFFKRDNSINYKKKFGLDSSKKNILFLVKGGFNNFRKGGDIFQKLLKVAPKNINFICIRGIGYQNFSNNFKNIHFIDQVFDQKILKELYLASDLNLTLSRNECIPYSIIESMSCGIPNIANNVGGINEAIEHKNTGWLVKNNSISSILNGIDWIFSSKKIQHNISLNSRKKIKTQFSKKNTKLIIARDILK